MFIGMNYVNGAWQALREDFPSVNPATEELLGKFPNTQPEEVNEAVIAAQKAQKSWRQLSRVTRGEYFDKLCALLKRDAEKLAACITLETGKDINESIAEVNEALHMTQYTFGKSRMPVGEILPSEIAEKDAYVIRKPKGVVAVISPWNFPFAIGGFWCAAPALLEGNTVVFKPSEETPMMGQMTAKLYEEAGFPKGVFNLIHGSGATGSCLVTADVNHICFTGSYEVGKYIREMCAFSGKKTCSCEMGSKSAVIVFNDVNIHTAVQACVISAYKLSGQRCVSAGRLLVQKGILNEFTTKFVEESRNVKLGPLISTDQKRRVQTYNDYANRDIDVKVLLDRGDLHEKGYYMGPFVYITEWKENEKRNFLKEEVFGPHVAIIPFNDPDDAVRIYNDTDFGLSLAVCTNDYRKMRKIREECEFGLGYVNLPCIGAESSLPFGGIKKSGYGGASAAASFDAVVNKATWTVNYSDEIKMAQGLKA